jgi:hypothetical protein
MLWHVALEKVLVLLGGGGVVGERKAEPKHCWWVLGKRLFLSHLSLAGLWEGEGLREILLIFIQPPTASCPRLIFCH